MICVILLSRRFGVNPDNVATPVAAALGDLVTLSLLSNITQVSLSVKVQSLKTFTISGFTPSNSTSLILIFI